jgi:hypothetical protein
MNEESRTPSSIPLYDMITPLFKVYKGKIVVYVFRLLGSALSKHQIDSITQRPEYRYYVAITDLHVNNVIDP